jgi:hypothetical protein
MRIKAGQMSFEATEKFRILFKNKHTMKNIAYFSEKTEINKDLY